MAPTRRRKSESSVDLEDDPEVERSPKSHRLSNGSRASTSGSTEGGSSSPATDMEEQEEEGEEEVAPAGRKGKGKRRAVVNDDAAEKEEEEEEEEANQESFADKSRRMAEICRQQEEEDRLNDGGGGEESGGDTDNDNEDGKGSKIGGGGKENEGLQPPKSKKANKNKFKKMKERKGGVKSSEAGVVLKIYVQNFMCHRKLSVQLCKQVNFINGRNGSGKSAILAALQICLGAKAHLTHRAKKMTDFIRHGWKGDAVLEVTLLNNEHGFKFDEYGDSITVRRTIKQPSGGGYALLDQNGEIKSRDRTELFRMLDTFNIQVDNPCAVLDQENSKKFLQGSEEDKYAFFMKATDLDRILADSEATGVAITKMRAGHHDLISTLPRYQEVVAQLKAELKEYEALQELMEKIERYREQYVWAIVNDAEERVAEADQDLKVQNVKISSYEEKIAELGEELTAIVASKEEVKARCDAALAETQRLKKEVIDKGKELQAQMAPLMNLRPQRTSLESEKREKQAARKAAANKVKAARETAKRSASDEKEKALLEQMQRTEDSLFNVARMKEGRGGDDKIFSLRANVQSSRDAASRAAEDFDSSNRELAARQADLRSLETGNFDPLSAIAKYMPALVRRIQQEARKFQSPPVGPLGASIQLKEEYQQFRICIEGHLSKNLSNFVVDSQQDKTKLMTLMKDFRRSSRDQWPLPTIIVQTPQARYRPPQNPPGCLQIMQAINVNNDVAFNALVDQCSIEKNCVFTSKAEAERVCLKGSSGSYQRMPHGMFEAYYPSQGGKSCNKFNVSDGNLQTRTNVLNVKRHKSALGVDEGTQKLEVRAQVQQLAAAVQQARMLADNMARSANAAVTALEKEEAERDRLETQERQLGREKSKLSTELMALQAKKNDATDPTEELERELEIATEELEAVTKELATMEVSIREMAAQLQPYKDAKEAAKKAHQAALTAAQQIQEEFEEVGQDENKKQQKINRLKTAVSKEMENLETLSDEKGQADKALQEALDKASKYMNNVRNGQWDGARVETRNSTQQLHQKIMISKERHDKERRKKNLRSKSKEEVENQLIQATSVFNEKNQMSEQLEDNMSLLSRERKQRTRKWKHMRDFVANRTSRLFDQYLQEKGASGEVSFDNDNQQLSLTYQKNSSDDASQCSDVKLLSGGEKSFATLALLLALGQCHECPFRVMDEFDVFMDAISRNIAIKQIIEFARKDSSRQFILITPQDLSSVTASEACKIIKMNPPRKGDHNQATLEEAFGGGAP
eukprot:g15001.t1